MPEGAGLLAAAGGAFLASEATGVTDVTPIGRGGGSDNRPGQGGSSLPPWVTALLTDDGGSTGIPPGLISIIGDQNDVIDEIGDNLGGASDSVGDTVGDTTDIIETFAETVSTVESSTTAPNLGDVPGLLNLPGIPSALDTPDGGPPGDGGDDSYDLQQDYTGPASGLVRAGAEVGAEGGGLLDTGIGLGESFAEQNPYTTTAAGAAAGLNAIPVVGNVGYGAAVATGGALDVTSDAVTGGAPLGAFNSPLDVTNEGAWWEGPDYADTVAGGTSDAVSGATETAGSAYQDTAGAVEGVWNSITPNAFSDSPQGNGSNRDPADTPEEPQTETEAEGDYGQPSNKLIPTTTSTASETDTTKGSSPEVGGSDSGRREKLKRIMQNPP